jgi:hypothetical protein
MTLGSLLLDAFLLWLLANDLASDPIPDDDDDEDSDE